MSQHTPNPMDMSGTFETTGTGGGQHERLTGVTGVFHHAAAVAREWFAGLHEHENHPTAADPVAEPTVVEVPAAEPVPEPEGVPIPDGEPVEAAPEAVQESEQAPQAPEVQDAPAEAAEAAPAAKKTAARKKAAPKAAPEQEETAAPEAAAE